MHAGRQAALISNGGTRHTVGKIKMVVWLFSEMECPVFYPSLWRDKEGGFWGDYGP